MVFMAPGDGLNNDLLFNLFEEHVKIELRKALSPVINQVVDNCIEEAVKSMGATLYKQYDVGGLTQTIKIIMEKK
jgi:hypothetical protein